MKHLKQEKPRKDIYLLAYPLILLCIIQFGFGLCLIAFAIALQNDRWHVVQIAQWTFALLAITMPFFGILGAWKCWISALFCFCIYCGAQFIWNVLYIIGFAIAAVYWKMIPEIVIAGIEIGLAVIMFINAAVLAVLLLNYRRMQE